MPDTASKEPTCATEATDATERSACAIVDDPAWDKALACGCGAGHAHADPHDHGSHEPTFYQRHVNVFLAVAGVFLVLAILAGILGWSVVLGQTLAGTSILLSGPEIFDHAWQELRQRRLNINFLMTIAAIGSFFILHGQEGATALFLFSVAERLEEYTQARSKRAVKELLELAPDVALLKSDPSCPADPEDAGPRDWTARTVEVPSGTLEVGQEIVVLPGKKIPADGHVACGASYVDQSAITGEAVPELKETGDTVYAGTVNGDGYLEVAVTTPPTEMLLARISREILRARANKSASERFVEKFARYYTPAIALLALLVVVIPPVFFGQDVAEWFYRGLVLLVVACPCALTLSTPVTMVAALTRLSSRGILVKGSKFLEELNTVRVMAFDKTGTITKGALAVHDVVPAEGTGTTLLHLLKIAASLEQKSEHPIARSILEAARAREVQPYPADAVTAFRVAKGRGIQAQVAGTRYWVGSITHVSSRRNPFPPATVDAFRAEGKTVIAVADDEMVLGLITVRDTLRPSALVLAHALQTRGIRPVILSGDDQATVDAIARELDVAEAHGDLLPDEKLAQIQTLERDLGPVAMVGDGINDAPALAVANVGIAMGQGGSDITIENSDVTLMNDDLTKVITLLNLSRTTAGKLRQNIWGSISIKLALVVLTLFGLTSLWVAVGVGDMGVSLAVTLNGLALLRFADFSFDIEASVNGEVQRVAVCVACGQQFPTPQHCGVQMFKRHGKLVCWRALDAKASGNRKDDDHYLEISDPLCPECAENVHLK